jgi:hypothetical protein
MSVGLRFDYDILLAAVERELSSAPSVRERRKMLDSRDPSHSQDWYLDEVLRDRADKSLEYIFSLLADVLQKARQAELHRLGGARELLSPRSPASH